ncbi:ABC transporter permease [Actinomadura sp. HBU206391]|uniref:ABC transporter permease n=1 Tax=Actinomadura sp. HBU206391 TaxID=2731692 RepID=UPI00165047B9|nr:ABC transporter permease [Actinomadura sp. HBU206391]MBC6462510.1 ABC transporter permease [Actinomadura sp. HBU206391]
MSTSTVSGQAAPVPRTEPRARFRHLLVAEWIKLWSLRSTYGVLVTGALLSIGICANSARANVHLIAASPDPGAGTAIDSLHSAFVPEAYEILMLIAAGVGAVTVFGEYASGLIRTTFAAVPDRRAVMAAKTVVVAATMLAFGAVVSIASFGLTQAIYDGQGIGLSISAPGALRAVTASALLAPLSALVGMALGALIRHGAGTVVAAVGVLLLLPILFQGETYRWVKEIGNATPLIAWDALTDNPAKPPPFPGRYPETITEAWIVFGTWPLVAAAIAVIVVHRRDL